MLGEHSLTVSSSPHIRAPEDTRSIMLDVCIALCAPLIIAVYYFGVRTLTLTVVSVVSCVVFEALYRRVMKKNSTIHDLSAVVTGMLLAYNLPASAPLWLPVVGSFFAIVIVKQLYGGLGKNFLNPALCARVFLFSWPGLMQTFTAPTPGAFFEMPVFGKVDAVTAATPLSYMKQGLLPTEQFTMNEMFLGQKGGSLGEVSVLILLLAFVYLLVRRVITPRIPVAMVGTVALLTFLFPQGGNASGEWMLYQVMSGGLMLGAVFMATDYTTSPVTTRGQWIYGFGCGVLTVFIRYFGSYPEGVSYAILLMNACVWLFDKNALPRRFGVARFKRLTRGKAGDQS